MNVPLSPYARTLLSAALALALTGCSDGGPPGARTSDTLAAVAPTSTSAVPDEAALAAEITANLQACSYDGAPVDVAVRNVSSALPSDCRDMVAQIMKFTGLPQNFKVVEAPVPNAAAAIVLDDAKIPQRVIAFNKDFMNIVRAETGGNAWAPVSIMAHEIGHHLSGHTITPGGSQPPTELEADKFSGFVLFKMGASLDDAQKAMATFVQEGPDGPTHPGRGKRLKAIADGWDQACEQQDGDCGSSAAAPSAQTAASAPPATATTLAPAPRLPAPPPHDTPLVAAPAAPGPDALPAPGSTPSKFNRFSYDELGLLDPVVRAEFDQKMFEHAQQFGVEIVSLLVKDLHGMSADDYAYAMMRQLRVGKLDVGNGAVLVVAPGQNDVGVAMGPGVQAEMKNYVDLERTRLRDYLEGSAACSGDCARAWTDSFYSAADHIREDTDWDWTIRYQSLEEIVARYASEARKQLEDPAGYDLESDTTWRKIARLEATVVALDAPSGDSEAFFVLESKREHFGRAVHARTADGRSLVLYLDPHTEGLMPAGALQAGKPYTFVARADQLSDDPEDSLSFEVLSYDLRG